MSTYLELQTQIQNEINNTAAATTAVVKSAILTAIAYYERERWWFTEGRTNTFATVASQELYSSSDASWIDDVADLDELTITVNGYRYQLAARTWEWIDARSVTTTSVGQPSDFAYYAQQIRLYPIPDAVYTVRFSGAVPLAVLSADGDTNAWTTTAEALIRARAKWAIFKNTLMDADNAAAAKAEEQDEYGSLVWSNSRRIATGRIIPQAF